MKRADYLKDRSMSNSTISRFIAHAHHAWLGAFLADNPTTTHRWKVAKMVPGDQEYLETFCNNPDRVRKNTDGAWEINILLPFGCLAPTGVAMNTGAAVDDFTIVADAIMEEILDTSGQIPEPILEALSEKVHQAWQAREKWRSGQVEFDVLNVPYFDLPEDEKWKDRRRVRDMYSAICKDCPAE